LREYKAQSFILLCLPREGGAR